MILDLQETKKWLRIEDDEIEEDGTIEMLISAAEEYLYNATGKKFNSSVTSAKLFCLVLVADWFANREYIGKATDKTRTTIESILRQLQYCTLSEES